MFERFTERARQVVVLAQEEAKNLRHTNISSDHILLGLLREEEGLACRVLEGFGFTADSLRASIIRTYGVGTLDINGQIPFTPDAKKVFEHSLREALALGHNYIGTEHILLGFVRLNTGAGMHYMEEYDVTGKMIRNEVIRILSGPKPAKPKLPENDPPEPVAVDVDAPKAYEIVLSYVADESREQIIMSGIGPHAVLGTVQDALFGTQPGKNLSSININLIQGV